MSRSTLIKLLTTATLTLGLAACDDGGGGTGATGGTGTGGTGGTGTGATGTGATAGVPDVPTCEEADLGGFWAQASLFKDGEDGFPGAGITVTGTVTEAGNGPIGTACFYAADDASGAFVKLADADGVSWTVCLVAPEAAIPLAAGDVITVDHHILEGDIVPPGSVVTIRKDDALVLYSVRANSLYVDSAPEVQINQGEIRCASDYDECDKERYAANAVAGDATVTIEPGDTATVGDFEVHFGGLDDIHDSGGCDSGSGSLDYFILPKP